MYNRLRYTWLHRHAQYVESAGASVAPECRVLHQPPLQLHQPPLHWRIYEAR